MSTASVIQAALIGVGGYGQYHLKVLRNLEQEKLLRLAAVADPFLDQMPEVKKSLEATAVRYYDRFPELFAVEKSIQITGIVSPIPLHEPMLLAALGHGQWVYLEKPPVPTIQQLEELIQRDTERKVTVGFQMSRFQHVQQLKKWMLSGALGEIRNVSTVCCWPRATKYYERAGWAGKLILKGSPVFDGPSTNALSHLIQMIMYLCGDSEQSHAIPSWVEGEFYRARPIESYDLAGITGAFPNGTTFLSFLGHCSSQILPYSIIVEGTRGKAWITKDGAEFGNDCGLESSAPNRDAAMAGTSLYRDIITSVTTGQRVPTISLEDCRGYLKTVCGGLISSGAIHNISGANVFTVGNGSERFYEVRDIIPLFERARTEGKLPSQLGIPWAKAGKRVKTDDVQNLDVTQFLS